MEGSKMAMILIAYIMVLAVFATGATALREDQGAVAPSPMESAGVALGVSAALAAVASMISFPDILEIRKSVENGMINSRI
ncbi:hypothetical protein REPUB_Repub13aG0217200 [Reevesia pubescens]